jgi:hypothetical protein
VAHAIRGRVVELLFELDCYSVFSISGNFNGISTNGHAGSDCNTKTVALANDVYTGTFVSMRFELEMVVRFVSANSQAMDTERYECANCFHRVVI